MTRNVVVVGAGIAGLTAAIGLRQAGLEVEVVERARQLTEIGAALSIWPNARAALARLGLHHALDEIGTVETHGRILRPDGEVVVVLDQRGLGGAVQIVHRADLQAMLLRELGDVRLTLHAPVVAVTDDGASADVELASGEHLRAAAVLGCDGIHSVCARTVGRPAPRYVGATTWRAILAGGAPLAGDSWLAAGGGLQFVASPVRDGDAYWSAMVPLAEGAGEAIDDPRPFLTATFAGWMPSLLELIGRTPPGEVVSADVFETSPRVLAAGRVALLGDAGHPFTPDLGQGACQAIEDGVVAAACLAADPDTAAALQRYQRLRLRRVRMIARESRWMGRVFSSPSAAVAGLRTATLRRLPTGVHRRGLRRYAGAASFEATLAGLVSTQRVPE